MIIGSIFRMKGSGLLKQQFFWKDSWSFVRDGLAWLDYLLWLSWGVRVKSTTDGVEAVGWFHVCAGTTTDDFRVNCRLCCFTK